jgi:hypothetical protein
MTFSLLYFHGLVIYVVKKAEYSLETPTDRPTSGNISLQ